MLVLAAALLLAGTAGAQQGPSLEGRPAKPPPPVAPCAPDPTAADCKAFKVLLEHFLRLHPAARAIAKEQAPRPPEGGRPSSAPEDVSLSPLVDSTLDWNAWYGERPSEIHLTLGFVRGSAAKSGAAPAVLAHELGHFVQAALGAPDPGQCDPRYESQADTWGVEIMRRAGYPAEAMPSNIVEEYGAQDIRDEAAFQRTAAKACLSHPPTRVRFTNALIEKQMRAMAGAMGMPAYEAMPGMPAYGRLGERAAESLSAPAPGIKPAPPARPEPKAPASSASPADMTPDLQPRDGSGDRVLRRELLIAVLALGSESSWNHPLVLQVLSHSAGSDASDLVAATAAGIERLAPSEAAKRETLRITQELRRWWEKG